MSNVNLDSLFAEAGNAIKRGNFIEIIEIYERIAQAGEPKMTAHIGVLYEVGFSARGNIYPPDLVQAVKWYQKAITDSDEPLAHLGMGRIFFSDSPSISKDLDRSLYHLQRAFDNKYSEAGIYLGIASMFGAGMEKDIQKAKIYFSSAAKAGFPVAYRYLANIYAESGDFLRTLLYLIREQIGVLRLKIIDRNHPNLWEAPPAGQVL